MRKYFTTLVLSIIHFVCFSQCEVKTINLDSEYVIDYMHEKFYSNDDLSNGIRNVYVFCDAAKTSTDKKIVYVYIVVNYSYSQSQKEFIPGQIAFLLANGDNVVINAKRKSSDTINERHVTLPTGVSTVEGIFDLNVDDIKSLIGGTISRVTLYNVRDNTSIDITPSYKGVISEMINCVIKKS